MLFFDRRKSNDGRSRKEQRIKDNQKLKSLHKQRSNDQRKGKERRELSERSTGMYHKLPEHKKDAVDRIIEILDREENVVEDDKRKDDRYVCKVSEFVHVNFAIKDASQKVRIYDLKVKDCAQNGLGIVITAKDTNLIENVNIGDQLKNVTFFSPWKVASIDGIITHKTKLRGDYDDKGRYIIGLKSTEPFIKYKPTYQ